MCGWLNLTFTNQHSYLKDSHWPRLATYFPSFDWYDELISIHWWLKKISIHCFRISFDLYSYGWMCVLYLWMDNDDGPWPRVYLDETLYVMMEDGLPVSEGRRANQWPNGMGYLWHWPLGLLLMNCTLWWMIYDGMATLMVRWYGIDDEMVWDGWAFIWIVSLGHAREV